MRPVSPKGPDRRRAGRVSSAPTTRRAFLTWWLGAGAFGLGAALGAVTAIRESSSAAGEPPATPVPLQPTVSPTAARTIFLPATRTPKPLPTSIASPAASPAEPTPVASATIARPLSPRQPNVLLVTIDTLRADRIGVYGFGQAHTPVLDDLAGQGVRFTRAVCQLPQTNASHAALMTGLYPSTSGVKRHMVDKLRPGSQTLARVFASAGYRTAGIYSWVSLDPQFCGLDQGFQTYAGYVLNRSAIFSDPRLEQLAATYRQLKAQVPIISTADAVLGQSEDIEKSLDGRADVTNDAVFKWLDAHDPAEPFFLWVHYFDPHYPYAPPSGYDHLLGLDYQGKLDGSVDTIHSIEKGKVTLNSADTARLLELYQGEIAYTDAQFGKLRAYLQKMGVEDDTIIAVTGDHGESFGEHDDWTHGLKVFETEIRVPLIFRYPRKLTPGGVIDAPAQLIDVMPTLLDLAGVRAAKSVQGASLVPVMTGKDNGSGLAAFTELADDSFVSVLTWGDWKLIRNDANGELQLYNLKVDEAERRNLVKDEAKTAQQLNARLQDLMKVSGVSR